MLGQILRHKSKNEKKYYLIIDNVNNNYLLLDPLSDTKLTIDKLDKELFLVDDFDIKNLQILYSKCYEFFTTNKLFIDYISYNPSCAQSKFYLKHQPSKDINHVSLVDKNDRHILFTNSAIMKNGTFINILISGKILNYDKITKKYLIQTNLIKQPFNVYLSKKFNIDEDIEISIYGYIIKYIDGYYLTSTNIYEIPFYILPMYIKYIII